MTKVMLVVFLVAFLFALMALGFRFFVRDRGNEERFESARSDQPEQPENSDDLAKKCHEYLMTGPPKHMTDYVPESLTEIVIAHGANMETLDPELQEIASIILMEAQDFDDIEDQEIREYMIKGADLVRAVLQKCSAGG